MFRRGMQWLAMTGLLALVFAAPAGAQDMRIYGALSNFDCYNDSGSEAEGFEIEIEGIHKEDIIHTWNYSAYGAPTIVDGGTPSAPTAITRYRSATASVKVGGVTHFGVTMRYYAPAGAIHYRWLPKATVAIPNPPPVPVVLPIHQAQVVYTNGVPMVQDVIHNTAPAGGKSFWVLPYAHLVRHKVELEDLMPTNTVVTGGIPMGGGSDHLQPERIDPGESWSNDEEAGQDDEEAAVFTYEIYEDVVTTSTGSGKKTHKPGRLISNMMDATVSASGPVVPNRLTFTDGTVYGTQGVTGTVEINGAAPAGGMVIRLASSDSHVQLPASVTIPAGGFSASFDMTTTPVASLTTATITASDSGNNGSIQGDLAVRPPDLAILWLAYSANFSGIAFDASVTLTTPAPTGGMTVQLRSNAPSAASVPDNVTVAAGETVAHFTVQGGLLSATKNVTIQATLGTVTMSQNVAINPSPRTISGAINLDGSVDLAQPMDFVLHPQDGSGDIPATLTLGADGSFTLPGVPSKKYDLAVKGRKWLRAVNVGVNVSAQNASGLSLLLSPGDLDNDNTVGLDDLVLFFDAYGSVQGDTNWNELADLNCDGSVELEDLSLFFDNYGKQGD